MNIEEAVETIQMNIRMYPAADVAEEAGVSVGTVYRWRKKLPRRPSLEVFVRLACFCNLNLHIRELRKLV
jgi:transcriptional regulator with XRE-family HTH domain